MQVIIMIELNNLTEAHTGNTITLTKTHGMSIHNYCKLRLIMKNRINTTSSSHLISQ